MDMQKKMEDGLGELFGLSRDAVIGVRGRQVVFANPAAEELFGPDLMDRPCTALLPEFVFEPEGDRYICSVQLAGRGRTVSAVRRQGLLLLTIPREEPPAVNVSAAILGELRTTAFNLRLASERILARAGTDGDLDTYACLLHHNYYSLLRLTNNLADASAIAGGALPFRPQAGDLAGLCRELVGSVNHFLQPQGRRILCLGCELPVWIHMDRKRIEQLLLNLMTNSLLYTPADGSITLELRCRDNWAYLGMDDTGSGIPDSQLGYLFSIRSQTEPSAHPGAGMGLFVAQGIARLHGGAMVIQSRPGEGTRVRVMLPVCAPPLFRESPTPQAPGPGLLLTELSPVLPNGAYREEYMD